MARMSWISCSLVSAAAVVVVAPATVVVAAVVVVVDWMVVGNKEQITDIHCQRQAVDNFILPMTDIQMIHAQNRVKGNVLTSSEPELELESERACLLCSGSICKKSTSGTFL